MGFHQKVCIGDLSQYFLIIYKRYIRKFDEAMYVPEACWIYAVFSLFGLNPLESWGFAVCLDVLP